VEIGPDSSDEQYEPNDTFETAHTLNISSQSSLITSFGRCDDIHTDETCDEDTACATSSDICLDNTCVTRDVDWYKLVIPAHTAVEVTAEFVNAYGDLELGLCTSAQCGHEQAGRLDYSDGFSGIETVNTSDAYDTLWVRVKLFWSNFYPTEQTYILSINPTELPHSNDTEVSDAGPTDTPTLMDAGLTDTPTLMDAGPTDGGL
jgi:hypothetical protein